jgi:type IV secretory pathway TraG/TraD family ATPase VirD4
MPNVNLLLDELAALGPMDSLNDVIDKGRAYSFRMQAYLQSLGQLEELFPVDKGHTFLSNTSQTFAAVNDPKTASYIQDRLGTQTIVVESGGRGSGDSMQWSQSGSVQSSRSHSSNVNHNWSQVGRPLLNAAEIMTLGERMAITFVPGLSTILTRLERYYECRIGPPRFQRLKTVLATVFVLALGTFAVTIALFAGVSGHG